MKKKIAIIGAGIGGLTLANRLFVDSDVTVFEKARGVGGRMSTRHNDMFTFDHGTQFFTVRDKRFAAYVAPHLSSGLIQEWKGKVITVQAGNKTTDRLWFEPHYVACPGMNSLCKKLAENITVIANCEVAPLGQKAATGWTLSDKDNRELGTFDLVISTAPPVQTSRLFDAYLPQDAALRRSKLLACYTMMFGSSQKWKQSWIAAKIHGSPIEWISVNSSKPDRDHNLTTLVVHSSNTWAEENANNDLKEMELHLRHELNKVLQLDISTPDYFSLHRWRYALLDKAHHDESRIAAYYDDTLQLASVGDWGSRSRVEDVWIEANNLADRILGH